MNNNPIILVDVETKSVKIKILKLIYIFLAFTAVCFVLVLNNSFNFFPFVFALMAIPFYHLFILRRDELSYVEISDNKLYLRWYRYNKYMSAEIKIENVVVVVEPYLRNCMRMKINIASSVSVKQLCSRVWTPSLMRKFERLVAEYMLDKKCVQKK